VTIIELVIILCLVGVGLYLLNQLVPMDQKIKTIINVVVVVCVLLWLLEIFGVVGPYPLNAHVPTVGRIR
jgi:uncharacterized protein YhhL (DUF1145 family)